jgi:hypothetical protein
MAQINFAGEPNIQLISRVASFLPLKAIDKLNSFNLPQNDCKSDSLGCGSSKCFCDGYLTPLTHFTNFT